MEILRSGFNTVLGGVAQSSAESPTPADTIERLVDRLISSTLLVRLLFFVHEIGILDFSRLIKPKRYFMPSISEHFFSPKLRKFSIVIYFSIFPIIGGSPRCLPSPQGHVQEVQGSGNCLLLSKVPRLFFARTSSPSLILNVHY